MAYSAKVMDHFANPRNVGEMKDYSGMGEVGNPKCGDIMRMYIKVEGNVITDVSFMTFGCGGGYRHQQHGHGDDQGQDHRGGFEAHQQSGDGSP